jgi:hypothetical protein
MFSWLWKRKPEPPPEEEKKPMWQRRLEMPQYHVWQSWGSKGEEQWEVWRMDPSRGYQPFMVLPTEEAAREAIEKIDRTPSKVFSVE